MSESEEHKKIRIEIQEKLDSLNIDYRQSHEERSETENPAVYIADPDDENNTRDGCRVSEPDIFIGHDKGVDIIEIEKVEDNSGKPPKYILGDIYSVHRSGFYRDKDAGIEEFDGICRLFVVMTENKPKDGTKVDQYQHIEDAVDFDNGTLDDLKILWRGSFSIGSLSERVPRRG